MTDSFWTQGPRRLRMALRKRRREVEELAAQLRDATDPAELERLEGELRRLLQEYDPTDDEVGRSLFLLR